MILARHAEALYWAGRLLERSEHATRALDVVVRNTMHYRMPRALAEWKLLLDVFALAYRYREAGGTFGRDLDRERVADFLFAEADNPGSVVSSVRQLRENVRAVRDRVPVELWEATNRLHLDLAATDAVGLLQEGPYQLFSSVRRGCQAISGVVAEAMPRDDGFVFFDSGRMIERSITTCRVVQFGLIAPARDRGGAPGPDGPAPAALAADPGPGAVIDDAPHAHASDPGPGAVIDDAAHAHAPAPSPAFDDDAALEDAVFDHSILLRLVTSLQAYRRMVGYDEDPAALAEFLLRAEPVPRSVLYCLRRVGGHLDGLQAAAPGLDPARRICGRVRSLLEFGEVERSLADDPADYLTGIEAGVISLGDSIARAFNPVHAPDQHSQFVRPGGGP